jgi:hypothetical protein
MKDNTRQDFAVATPAKIKSSLIWYILKGHYCDYCYQDAILAIMRSATEKELQLVIKAVLALTSDEGISGKNSGKYWYRSEEKMAWKEKSALADCLEIQLLQLGYETYMPLRHVIIRALSALIKKRGD